MDPKSAAQVIRDSVTMEQIIALYGYKTKHGFMVCPFHGDRDASLKIYPGSGGWHCFGCGKGGSVVDFVMEHENCDFRTAVAAIDKAMRLGLQDPQEDAFRAENEHRKQQWLDNYVEAIYSYSKAVKLQLELKMRMDLAKMKELEMLREMEPPQLTAADYDFMSQWKENAEYDEYRLKKIEEYEEEVAAWRRKARRAK